MRRVACTRYSMASWVGTFKYLILLWIFIVIHPKLQLCMWLWIPRKESPMDHGQLSMVADKFQWVFSESLLNTCGKDVKFCRRTRIITPFRLGLALTATCASQRVETLADFYRSFNALFGTSITYKAFYNQLAKPHFADFLRTMTSRLVGEMTLKVLGFEKGRAFAEFRHIVLQDGSSFAIHDGLREVFPGRFKVVKPAAVELHTTMDLLCDAPTTVVLTPDTTSEQAFLPEPASLRASLLLADRGYVDLHYLRRVQDAGGFFLIRAKAGMNPQVLEAFREDGKRLRSLRNKPLKAMYAKLHAFDTENPAIVEGLIWAAIAGAALKRFLAHMTQLLVEVPMSTRKVAMCAVHVLGGIIQALKTGDVVGLSTALEAAMTYLAGHAQRAHPKRDRHTGRSQLGLEPLFGSDDVVEFAEAA